MSVRKFIASRFAGSDRICRGAHQGVGRLALHTVRRLELGRHGQPSRPSTISRTSSSRKRCSAHHSAGWVQGSSASSGLRVLSQLLPEHEGSGNFEFGDSNLTTLMGNLVIGVPIGGQSGLGFRPYAVGGVGIIKSSIGFDDDFFEDFDSTDFGINVGAGAMFFFSDKVGLRGDVRYFRSLQDVEPIDDFRYRARRLPLLAGHRRGHDQVLAARWVTEIITKDAKLGHRDLRVLRGCLP